MRDLREREKEEIMDIAMRENVERVEGKEGREGEKGEVESEGEGGLFC